MKSKSLVLLSCLSVLPVFAGGESGGGGGGICYNNGKCVTLAQAGVRISEEQSLKFEIGIDVIEELNSIKASMKSLNIYQGNLKSIAVGEKNDFAVLEEVRAGTFSKFKKQYLQILAKQKIKTEGFELLAVTTENKFTYILPGYERLDAQGKALILIHEGLIRKGKSVANVVKFDGVLLDFITHKNDVEYNVWPMISALHDMGLLTYEETNHRFLIDALKGVESIPFDNICDGTSVQDGNYSVGECKIPFEKALNLRTLNPNFARYLSEERISYNEVRLPYWRKSEWVELESKIEVMRGICSGNPDAKDLLLVQRYSSGEYSVVRLLCD